MTVKSYSHIIRNNEDQVIGKIIINSIEGRVQIFDKDGKTLEELTRSDRGDWQANRKGYVWAASTVIDQALKQVDTTKETFDSYLKQQGLIPEFYTGRPPRKPIPPHYP